MGDGRDGRQEAPCLVPWEGGDASPFSLGLEGRRAQRLVCTPGARRHSRVQPRDPVGRSIVFITC